MKLARRGAGTVSIRDKLLDYRHKISFTDIFVIGEQSDAFSLINQNQGRCSNLSIVHLIDVG